MELYRKSGTAYAEVAHGLECDPGSSSDWAKKIDAPRGENPFQMAEDLRRLRHGMDLLHYLGQIYEGLRNTERKVPTWQTPGIRGSSRRSSSGR